MGRKKLARVATERRRISGEGCKFGNPHLGYNDDSGNRRELNSALYDNPQLATAKYSR